MKKHLSDLLYNNRVTFISIFLCSSALFIYNFKPEGTSMYPGCPFKLLTGFYCPGCGSLRCCHQLIHGNFLSALDSNPLAFLLIPFLLFSFLNFTVKTVMKYSYKATYVKSAYIWMLLSTIIIFGILRNIPVEPFILLAP